MKTEKVILGKYTVVPCRLCGHLRAIIAYTWLRKVRLISIVSLRRAAKRIKVSPAYLSDVELGRRGITNRVLEFYEKLDKKNERRGL